MILRLDHPDRLSGERFALRAEVRVSVAPAPVDEDLRRWVAEALEAAIGVGQGRYGLYRDELPSRRSAVEEAARPALEAALGREGLRLLAFALLALEPAPG